MTPIAHCLLTDCFLPDTNTDPFLTQHGLSLFCEGAHWILLVQAPGFEPVDSVLLSFYSDKHVRLIQGKGRPSGLTFAHRSAMDYVQQLLLYATTHGLSDVHLQPDCDQVVVKGRDAGQLMPLDTLTQAFAQPVYSRIKVLANLDLTERRQPQDGRLSIQDDEHRQYEFRLSCCPVIGGEKLVLRCLQPTQAITPLQYTGLLPEQYRWFSRSLAQMAGLILVTGPTGSGKTSTLYSAIRQLDAERYNICSVEDPVEVPLPGCSQMMVNAEHGLGFAHCLRALLRQDPDVILMGEIRDAETAKIAIQAAQTGHLVLTSLHTSSALDSLKRLQSLGVNPFDIRSTLKLLVSQRLLPAVVNEDASMSEVPTTRQAVFEVVPWLEHASSDIPSHPTSGDLRRYLQRLKLPDLAQALSHYINEGVIAPGEYERFTYDNH